jgi:hypothetical protein
MQRRLAERTAEVKALSLTSHGVPTALFAQACPAPCVVIDRNQLILDVNEPAQRWMQAEENSLVGKNIGHYLQIKSVPPLDEVVRQFGEGIRKVVTARLLHVRPGRLMMARANLCPAVVEGAESLAYFLIISD